MASYGSNIKAAREAAGMTQEELGARLGVTGVTVMRYEKEVREPNLKTIAAISDILDTSVSSLLGRDPDPLSPALQRSFLSTFLKRVEGELMQSDPADLEEAYGTTAPYEDVFEGRYTLTLDKAKDISDELGVPLEYLIAGENNPADHYPLDDEDLEASIDLAEARLIETVHRICGMYTRGARFAKEAWNPVKIDLIREYLDDSQAVLKKMLAAASRDADNQQTGG